MLKNLTSKNTISNELRFCNTILSKATGLMFSRKTNKSLIFTYDKEKKESLHMLFVFYPIDVIFLDKDKKVVEIKENFKPFTFYNPKHKAQYIIELPSGTVDASKTKVGHKISF